MPKINKRLKAAQDAHAKFLAKHGIDAHKKPRLRGVQASDTSATSLQRKGPSVALSDAIPASGGKRAIPQATGEHVIGQAYNKGPLMVLGGKSELKNSNRRDR